MFMYICHYIKISHCLYFRQRHHQTKGESVTVCSNWFVSVFSAVSNVHAAFQRSLICTALFSSDSCTVVRAPCPLCAHSAGNMQINTNIICNATSVSAHSLGIR